MVDVQSSRSRSDRSPRSGGGRETQAGFQDPGPLVRAQNGATYGSADGARPPHLVLHEVSKSFESMSVATDRTTAVDRLSIEIHEGEIFGLLGPSGCGKSTTLRCIAGLEMFDSGAITVGGIPVADPGRSIFVPPERRNMAMVFQSYGVWPHMTVAENVAFPLRVRHVSKKDRHSRVMETLRVTGLEDMADRPATKLSGGQQQRVALARALVYLPTVLLLDEPLSNLDGRLRDEMRHEILRIQREVRVTVVFVTHDRFEAMALSDRMAILRDGQVDQIGTPRELYESPNSAFSRDFLGDAVSIRGRLKRGADGCWLETEEPVQGHRVNLPSAAVQDVEDGSLLEVGCRPEDVEMVDAVDGDTRLQGRIEDAVYQGTHIEYVVRIGGQTSRFWGPRGNARQPGETISLSIDAGSCWVWESS